ncbi:MAG: NAD(P)-dependent alcohol dehydrogenase [Aeromicrobium sp.]
MTAIVQDHYGSSERLALVEIDTPSIGDHEVLVCVRAAGVNPGDWAIMSGLPYVARPVYGIRRPKERVRGTDVAGTVEAVGVGVTRFKPGDEVYGSAHGSFAAYAAAAEDELALKPTNISFEQAAAAPMAGLVAMQALRKGNVGTGTKVLINGASGGIGTFAVQIAKSLDAHVTAVCSTKNLDLVRSMGADEVIDYTKEDFTQSGRQYDFILDNVSNRSLSDLRRALGPKGTLVPNGGRFDNRWLASGGRILRGKAMFRSGGQKLGNFLVSMKYEDLVVLKELIEAGKVTPVIDRTYPLSESAQAIAHVGGGHAQGGGRTRGKVAITLPHLTAPAAPAVVPAAG